METTSVPCIIVTKAPTNTNKTFFVPSVKVMDRIKIDLEDKTEW